MLFAQLIASAAVLGGTVSAAPARMDSAPAPLQSAHRNPAGVVASLQTRSGGLAPRAASMEARDEFHWTDWVNNRKANGDKFDDRNQVVQHYTLEMTYRYRDCNVFMYHQFGENFKWSANDIVHQETVSMPQDGFWGNLKTEYYKVIVFKGEGYLELVKGDGGWLNWGWRGNYERVGDTVYFH